jgi:hypothetical protein
MRRRTTHLCQNVIHRLACLLIPLSENAHESQSFHLQEGISDPGYVVFWTVTRSDEGFESAHEKGYGLCIDVSYNT